ncbi:MAG: NUDIX hydrolase [Actinobacteria bacterium]|nr:NUDIX hydrolase [Actinomycetota bacterium]
MRQPPGDPTNDPRGPAATVGVGAVICEQSKVLLILRGRDPYLGHWSLPGGGLEFGETVEQAIVREVREETNLVVEPQGLAWIFESIDPGGSYHFVIIDHFARIVSGEPKSGDDASDIGWFSAEQIRAVPTTPGLFDLLLAHDAFAT